MRVRVEHRNAVRLVPSHHLLHLIHRDRGVGAGPEQRQRREPDPTPEPDHLQVLHELVGAVPLLHGGHQVESLAGHHRRLQVRHGLVPLQRVQSGVVPRVLVQRDAQRQVLGPRGFEAHVAVVVSRQPQSGAQRRLRHLREHDMSVAGARVAKHPAERRVRQLPRERRRLVDAHLPRDDRRRLPELQRKLGRGSQRRKTVHSVPPRLRASERHLHLGHHPVGPVGVHHGEDVAAAELQYARGRFRGDDAEAQHGAVLGESAVRHRADAGGSAGDEAAQRRRSPGAGMLPELPPLRSRRLLERGEVDAGVRADDAVARVEADDLVHRREVQHEAASHRDRLAVVAGARASRRERNPPARGDAGGVHDVLLGPRHDQGVALHPAQLPLELGGVPVEVPGRERDPSRGVVGVHRVDNLHAALPQLRDRAGDRLGRHARAARIEDNGSARILLRAPYEASDDGPSVRAHLGVIR